MSERQKAITVTLPLDLIYAVIDTANRTDRTPGEVISAALAAYTQPVQEVIPKRGRRRTAPVSRHFERPD